MTAPGYYGLRVGDQVLGPIPSAQETLVAVIDTWAKADGMNIDPGAAADAVAFQVACSSAAIGAFMRSLDPCRCVKFETEIRATGPVHCRTCGRRVGSDR